MIINASDLDRVRQAELARGVIFAMQDDQESQQPRNRLAAQHGPQAHRCEGAPVLRNRLRVATPFGRGEVRRLGPDSPFDPL